MKNMKPVVVYVTPETVRNLDALAHARSLLRPFGQPVSRSCLVREAVEHLAAAAPEVVRSMAVAVNRARP